MKRTDAGGGVDDGHSADSRSTESALATRHAGTLGGRLTPMADILAAHVEVVVSSASASTRSGQVLTTHLANLLGRLEGVVGTLSVTIEGTDVELLPGVDPWITDDDGGTLTAAFARAAALVSTSRYQSGLIATNEHARIRVGIGATVRQCDIYTAAGSWGAFVGTEPRFECLATATGAVGGMLAASFAAADVFRMLRVVGKFATRPVSFVFDAWGWGATASLSGADDNAPDPRHLRIPAMTVAGVGAVGCAMLLALWLSGCEVTATLVDGDRVSLTNLNRYVLFALRDRGHFKAVRAAELLYRERSSSSGPVSLLPVSGWWSAYARADPDHADRLLISCVDTNTVRSQLQDALPRIILGASTHGLRAEIGRYDLADPMSRCLKCFNHPEASETDLLLHRRLIGLAPDELVQHAEDAGLDIGVLQRYVADLRSGGTGCAILSGPALDRVRRSSNEEAFAVSFVASMAGVLLAAQIMREAIGVPLLTGPTTRAILQLTDAAAESNTVHSAPRESHCWCAQPLVRATFASLWTC